jgi:hypothetical protein
MLIEEAITLCGDPTLCPSQIQSGFEVVDVKDDFILTHGERVQVIEIRKEKPDFAGVGPDSLF